MSIVTSVEKELPYLRRYARAVTGSTSIGDDCVARALQSVLRAIEQGLAKDESFEKSELFRLVDLNICDAIDVEESLPHRALLLVAMEGLSEDEVCEVLDVQHTALRQLIATAEDKFRKSIATAVLIIEDEALIAAQLKRIVSDAGHTVVGVATRATEAVALGRRMKPDLILCDIHLAGGTIGTDAIAELDLPETIPVIYITAYPEDYLSTANKGPSYLVAKPFDTQYVKTIIAHALLTQSDKAG